VQKSFLTWGLGIGVVSAVLGVAGLVVGALVEPVRQQTTAEVVVTALFIRGMIVLLTLAVAFGLAYYAGTRVAVTTSSRERAPIDAAIAGGLVMACYWVATTICIILQGNADVREASVLTLRVVFGVLFVLIGAGLGGLGARAFAARQLLPNVLATPAAPPASPSGADDA